MQLIATARFQAALSRATGTKPYAQKLVELVSNLSKSAAGGAHPLMNASQGAARAALVIITSNRGLCGGYNANVLRAALEHLKKKNESGVENDVYMVGKKGANYFKFLRRPVFQRVTGVSDAPRFEQIEPLANDLMARFANGEIAAVHVAFMRFESVARQQPAVIELLPLTHGADGEAGDGSAGATPAETLYEFSPGPQELLNELLPATVRVRLFQCFTDAVVSEQIARMVAMKAATDAAGDMITALTRQYNRARQTQITMELLDIVGGANALG